jgi:hypothetical protein
MRTCKEKLLSCARHGTYFKRTIRVMNLKDIIYAIGDQVNMISPLYLLTLNNKKNMEL